MGEKAQEALKLQFDKRWRLEFHGARITSDAGLLACRELDEALGLTKAVPTYLRETRGGRNVQHELTPLLRQSVYARLAGYEDTNDAVRLAKDPAMQAVVGHRALERQTDRTIIWRRHSNCTPRGSLLIWGIDLPPQRIPLPKLEFIYLLNVLAVNSPFD